MDAMTNLMTTVAVSSTAAGAGRKYWIRTIAYWTFTLIAAWEMVAGSMWDVLRIEYVRAVMTHLGYPLYFLFIIGVWKFPCGVALLVPRFPRLKEWAYAGAFFNYSGAVASHCLVGDGADKWVAPLIFAAFTLASWALRQPARRLPDASPATRVRSAGWIAPLSLVAVFVVLSLLTLPKGPPPP
jgi:uncharacterized membrane protein YphA (DoxX/SURF4 family)